MVLRAALDNARDRRAPVLIEATCNQVNPDGGYTGMDPARFRAFVLDLADGAGCPRDLVILGGDHLGPSPWRREPAHEALARAGEMVAAYARAGFRKIHLDASMACAQDPSSLPVGTIAAREAELCARAEAALTPGSAPPVYVIGTEVPTPGGQVEPGPAHAGPRPTPAAEVEETLEATRRAFLDRGLEAAWERVVALVVQPGVEFGESEVHPYDREAARHLSGAVADRPPWMYEAHSTDYQTPRALRQLVEDRFAILKVGPWLTFACREALFALEDVARELHAADPRRPAPRLRAVLEAAMLRKPGDWQGHYQGSLRHQAYARRFSYSDRSRYYWNDPEVAREASRLLEATAGPLPPELLSQYLPFAQQAVWEEGLPPTGPAVVLHAVRRVLAHYDLATAEER
jgi:D-tagatose-1,6-bisphosphate aldolase subunit GatZ/KbaZ